MILFRLLEYDEARLGAVKSVTALVRIVSIERRGAAITTDVSRNSPSQPSSFHHESKVNGSLFAPVRRWLAVKRPTSFSFTARRLSDEANGVPLRMVAGTEDAPAGLASCLTARSMAPAVSHSWSRRPVAPARNLSSFHSRRIRTASDARLAHADPLQ